MPKRKTNGTGRKRGRPPKDESQKAFPLDRDITIEGVSVIDLHAQPKDDDKETKIAIVFEGTLPIEAATALGRRELLFIPTGLPREGYGRATLDIGRLAEIRLKTNSEFKGEQTLDARASTIGGFIVKPVLGRLKVRFRARFSGYVQHLTDFVNQVGKRSFDLVFQPLQGELFEPTPKVQPAVPISHLN